MPRVSVLIPSFNHCRYIEVCIDSVLAQTFSDIEIVVVDDGSTDGSIDILRGYGDQIILIEQANRGTQAARNTAITASSGELLALLDSDDVWLPNKLERQIAELDRHPTAGLVYSFAYRVDEQGERISGGPCIGEALRTDRPILSQMILDDPVPALTAVFRRSCLDALGGFDESLFGSADWDLWLRIAADWDVISVPEPLALYREHDLNTTKVLFNNKKMYLERCALVARTIERYPDKLSEADHHLAWSRTYLLGAEIEIHSGNVDKAGELLASAITHDPEIVHDETQFVGRMVHWANIYCSNERTGSNYRYFVDELFRPVCVVLPHAKRLQRRVLSNATMSVAFSRFGEGDLATVRSVLPTGIAAQPAWLRNRGVWSMGIKSFLASRKQ